MELEEIERRVLAIVRETVPGAKNADAGAALVLLGDEGIFDSVTALELIVAIEREFSIVVRDDDVRPENLASVASIAQFVQRRLLSPPDKM